MQVIYNFLLFLDGVVYSLVDYVYDIFDFLAKLNIFDSEQYGEITGKIYIILGLIMMFVLSYSLLRAVMNPDDFAKGEKSFPNLIKNIIISLALIVVMPAIFEFATDFQMAILDNNTIPKFILGDSTEVDYEGTATADESVTNDAGRMMSYYVFRSFFYPNPDWCSEKNHGYASAYGTGDDGSCTEKIKGNGWWGLTNGDAFYEVDQNVLNGESSFFAYSDYGESTADGRLTYYMLITTIAGGFLVYVLASFCFDMAIRVIKLAFYELIAPIPIICRILPGGNMKDVFSKWVKQIISVYIEVFIRVAIMYLGVYLIKIVVDAIGTTSLAVNGLSWHKQAIVVGLLIVGVIIFIKQAPKLIGDMFHLDTGGMKLGIMDKLAMGGVFAAGGAVGSLITSRGNPIAAIRGWKYGAKNKDFKTWGQEANYRLEKKAALAEGATRRQIALDRLRRSMGFDTKVESENRKIDTQVRELDLEIEEIKAPLTLERVKERVDGNSSFIKIKDSIEDRIKKKLNDEKSGYMAEISFDIEVEHNHGIDSQGNPIITKSVEHRTQSGNLNALRKYLQSNSGNMTTEQITAFNQQIAAAEKGLVSQYLKDNVTNAEGTDGATDAVVRNFVSDIRSSGVLDTTLMNSDGISELSEENRDAILHSEDLWGVLDDVGKEVSESISELNRQTANINQKTLDKVYEKQRLEGSKSSRKNRAYKASSDFSGKRPGSGK